MKNKTKILFIFFNYMNVIFNKFNSNDHNYSFLISSVNQSKLDRLFGNVIYLFAETIKNSKKLIKKLKIYE